MALEAICPSCGHNGDCWPHISTEKGPEFARGLGADPDRVSALWFKCGACLHEFPAYVLADPNVEGSMNECNLRDMGTGKPFMEAPSPWWAPSEEVPSA